MSVLISCPLLGGSVVGGECRITGPVIASDAIHGGPFAIEGTLRVMGTGSITVPAAAGGNSLTLNVLGDFIVEVPTVTNRGRVSGDVSKGTETGATITVNAGGDITRKGNGTTGGRVTSNQSGGSCSAGHGGDISLLATGSNVTVAAGAPVTSIAKCHGGEIVIAAGLAATIDGQVTSEGTTTVARGGPITILSECTLTVGDKGKVVSKGLDPGADLVHLEGGCQVLIQGIVSST